MRDIAICLFAVVLGIFGGLLIKHTENKNYDAATNYIEFQENEETQEEDQGKGEMFDSLLPKPTHTLLDEQSS